MVDRTNEFKISKSIVEQAQIEHFFLIFTNQSHTIWYNHSQHIITENDIIWKRE